MTNLKNNIYLTMGAEVRNICKSLFENSEITDVFFSRIYPGNKVLGLTTNPSHAEWNIKNKSYKVQIAAASPTCNYQLKTGFYLIDNLNCNDPLRQEMQQGRKLYFSYYHNLVFMRSTGEYVEGFDFGTNNKNSAINEWYLSNIDVLEKFMQYFKARVSNILNDSDKYCFHSPDLIEPSGNKVYRNIEQGLIRDQDVLKTKVEVQYEKLTAREKECLYWLFCGKTAPEIALILNISKRTVEKFISNLKEKFNCYTLFQLGDALSALRNKTIMLERFT